MGRNTKISLAVAGLVLAASPVMAQSYPTPTPTTPTNPTTQPTQGLDRSPQETQRRTNEILFKDITLTADQQRQVDSIMTKSRDAERTLRQSDSWQQDSTNAQRQLKDLKEKMLDDIRPILTMEQQPVFARNRQTLSREMPDRPSPTGRR